MTSLYYINSKLSDAIFTLTTHEGDARARLAKVIPKIKVLSTSSFPSDLQDDFNWIKTTINRGIGSVNPNSPPLPPPDKLTGITNKTASKVIGKILNLQEQITLRITQET